MKLIYCPYCHDIRKLHYNHTICDCARSGGSYLKDGLNAVTTGDAIPLGFNNTDFVRALKNRPKKGKGEKFEAFVIPKKCPTVEENPDSWLDTD